MLAYSVRVQNCVVMERSQFDQRVTKSVNRLFASELLRQLTVASVELVGATVYDFIITYYSSITMAMSMMMMWLSERQICAYVSVRLYKSSRVLTCLYSPRSPAVVSSSWTCRPRDLTAERTSCCTTQSTSSWLRSFCYIIAFLPRTLYEPPYLHLAASEIL